MAGDGEKNDRDGRRTEGVEQLTQRCVCDHWESTDPEICHLITGRTG